MRALVPFLALAVAATAHAQEVAPTFDGCAPELEAAIRAALVVELTDAEPDVLAALPSTWLRVTCAPDALALRADETASGTFVGQTIPVVAGTPRRAAITLLELTRALTIDAPSPSASPSRAPSLLIASGALTLGAEPLALFGGLALSLRLSLDPAFQLGIAIDGALGALTVAPGDLDVRLLSGAISARFGGRAGPVALHAGPAVSAGLVSWSGTPIDPEVRASDVLGPRLAFGAVAAASLIVEEALAIDLELALDWNVLGSEARADGVAVARMLGPMFAVRLGLGWVLP